MGNDPWKHRSTGMKCQTCMWFVKKEVSVAQVTDFPRYRGSLLYRKVKTDKGESFKPVSADNLNNPPPQTAVGRCRRHAPTMNGYPVVFDTDWCGDHKLNEEAL